MIRNSISCVLISGLSSVSLFSLASTGGVNQGSSLTSGPSSNHYSLYSASRNPAMSSLMVDENERWRMNYFLGVSVNFEVGKVDNFADDLDELIDLIDDPSTNTDPVEEVLTRFNGVLEQMGEDGYLKTSTSVTPPLFPLFYRSDRFSGTFFAEFSMDTQIGLSLLDDELIYDDQNGSFATSTALYLKAGIENRLSFGYGTEISDLVSKNLGGNLHVGVKVNYFDLELSKQVMPLQILDGQEVSDVLEDEYDKNLVSTTGIGIDIGAVYEAERYRMGLSINNLNSPSFSYGTVGVNCSEREENTISRSSCEASAYFIETKGELKSREEHTKHAVATIDSTFFITKKWALSASADLAKYDDLVGMENQWMNVATSYTSSGYWMPAPRIGYQSNLAGDGLASMTFGFTLFKTLTMDFEYGLESVSVDGSSSPRRVGFAIGFEESF